MKLKLAGLVIVIGTTGMFHSFGDQPSSNAATESTGEIQAEVIPIRHERAADIAAALNSLTTNYHGLGTNSLATKRDAENALSNAWTALTPQLKERNSQREANRQLAGSKGTDRIIADERANTVLIPGLLPDSAVLKQTISKLDAARQGILIEAVVFEVTTSGANNSQTIRFPGSGSQTSPSDFDAFVHDLGRQSDVKILQRPRIQTAEGIAATLFVGDSRYCSKDGHEDSHLRDYQGHHSMNELLGTTLQVSPTITRDRKVRMNVAQTTEKYAGITNIANVGTVPITSRQNLQTELTVADRQTVVIGGPVELTQNKPSKGVPVLKNAPLIGGLFRNHPRKIQVETLLALRATILPQEHAGAF